MIVYLAGPLGFSEAGRHFHGSVLLPSLRRIGLEVIDPWALTDPADVRAIASMPAGEGRLVAWRRLNQAIGRRNSEAIDACDAVVAVLDGVDVDSGTAAEVGYAFARGKRIFGYRGDFRLVADNEGAAVNLQVEYFILASGGTIVGTVDALAVTLRDLADRRVLAPLAPVPFGDDCREWRG